jgi:hypothetical protein
MPGWMAAPGKTIYSVTMAGDIHRRFTGFSAATL